MASLLDWLPKDVNIFGAAPSGTAQKLLDMGLVDPDALKRAQQASLFKGGLSTILGYLAQPKNRGYGSAIPYLAQAGLSGVQAAQKPFDSLTEEAMTGIKLEELQRQKSKEAKKQEWLDTFGTQDIGTISDKDLQAGVRSDAISVTDYFNITKSRKEQDKGVTLGPGQGYFSPTGEVIIPTQPFKPDPIQGMHATTPIKTKTGEYVYPVKPEYQNVAMPVTIDGKPYTDKIEPAPDKPLTEQQESSRGFYTRMNMSNQIFDEKIKVGDKEYTLEQIAGNPQWQEVAGLGEWSTSEARKKYVSAARNWIRANLRKESGAAIGEKEMEDEFKTYFPQLGDTQAVKDQKRLLRKQVTLNMWNNGRFAEFPMKNEGITVRKVN